ncbi:MAG: cytochrome c biogenesis CcdA family protein [Solirubrobacterales bacterium]
MDPGSAVEIGPTLGGVAVIGALFAGLVSFLSPCVLPLVPGYVSVVTGVSAGDLDDVRWQRVIGPSLLFIAAFSAIFIALGLGATAVGQALRENQRILNQIAGIAIIAMGVFFVATLFITRLNAEWRIDALMERASTGGPLVAGAAFAIAWTPCSGPTLGAILTLAGTSESASTGAMLLAAYSAGLAIPFLLTSISFSRMTTAFSVIKRHYRAIMATGGIVLIVMGVLVYTGEIIQLNIEAQQWLDNIGLNFFADV